MRSTRLVWLLLLAACEIEKIGIPRTDAHVALHGVLSASAPNQVILLERTRNGTLAVTAPSFEVLDPVLSDEGIAERNAILSLTTPSGATLIAREGQTPLVYTAKRSFTATYCCQSPSRKMGLTKAMWHKGQRPSLAKP